MVQKMKRSRADGGRRKRPKRNSGRVDDARSKRKPQTVRVALFEWIKAIAIAFAIYMVLRTFVVQTFVITSGSMENTLLVGDMLVVNRAAIGSRIPFTDIRIPGYSEPARGDVIVFDPHHEDTLTLVKRLVGLPGDTLEMRVRELILNGEPYPEPYVRHIPEPDQATADMLWQRDFLVPGVDPQTYRPSRDNWGPIIIPEDRYFMLGDNREASLDSRYWGLLAGWRLEGRASFTYWSYERDSLRPFPWLREVRWNRLFRGID